MSGRTLEVFCDDARYPAMTDAQLSECIATIRAFSQGHPVRLESESWFGNFRSLLPMYWKYKQDAEYWKSWQDPDKIKNLEAENADLLAIAQGQRAALLAIWPFVEEDDGGFATPEYQAAIDKVRAILGIGTKK